MRHLIQIVFILVALSALAGCVGPAYGPTYGYPEYGYAPYSYGYPVYTGGYRPDFDAHHVWEEHHAVGHPGSFYHAPAPAPHFSGGHPGAGPAGRAGGGRSRGAGSAHGEHH